MSLTHSVHLPALDYDLAATLTCGQAFRWQQREESWTGVIHGRWVRLRQHPDGIHAETAAPATNWKWLSHYLQTDVQLHSVLTTFPDDEPLRAAITACRGLRLLRQEPWECLASFILSSTKQIVQIRQIITALCERYGEPVAVPSDEPPAFSFPTPERLAALSEADLRACKMGFRAPYLLRTARLITEGKFDLNQVTQMPLVKAREEYQKLPGVGAKIADCALLFSGNFPEAFPIDVWVLRALRDLYFPRRRPKPARIRRFAATYFGPHAGYAQQYLFHYIRIQRSKELPSARLAA